MIVEEALLLSAELELNKAGTLAGAYEVLADVAAYQRVYGRPFDDLIGMFRAETERAQRQSHIHRHCLARRKHSAAHRRSVCSSSSGRQRPMQRRRGTREPEHRCVLKGKAALGPYYPPGSMDSLLTHDISHGLSKYAYRLILITYVVNLARDLLSGRIK